jgi:hypothetical protein
MTDFSKLNSDQLKKLDMYAEAIFTHFGKELLKYQTDNGFEDFITELDYAIMDGDIKDIPNVDREPAFELALSKAYEEYQDYEPDESMDGDFDSAMKSAGWGTDEDYGYAGDDIGDFFGESTLKEADEIMKMLKDSFASKKAKKLGLVHVGFGNYAEDPGSKAEYKTVDGKLRKIGGTIPKKQKAQISAKAQPKKEEPKKEKEKPKSGITNIRRVSGQKFTYQFEKDGKPYKFTLTKQERVAMKSEGSIMTIIKKRLEKKSEREKSKQFKKGKHVSTTNTK